MDSINSFFTVRLLTFCLKRVFVDKVIYDFSMVKKHVSKAEYVMWLFNDLHSWKKGCHTFDFFLFLSYHQDGSSIEFDRAD